MKYLGIDYGEKRIGFAVSDTEGKLAMARGVVSHDEKIFESIKKIIVESATEAVVVGLPLDFSMQETELAKRVRVFGKFLKKELGIEIFFQNEILSTKEIKKSNAASGEYVDASSAALILQSFLDQKNRIMLQ